jgi:putative endonuclease
MTGARKTKRLRSHLAGQAAEEAVLRTYEAQGYRQAATRWRSPAGEIDLILRKGDLVIFVEVKQARNFGRASEALSARQAERILTAAALFLDGEPRGQLTETRLDLALVNGEGAVEIVENALAGF